MSPYIESKIYRHLQSMTGVLSRRLLVLHASQFRALDQFSFLFLFAIRSIPAGKERVFENELLHHVRHALMDDSKGLRSCFGLKIRKLSVLPARDLKHALELFNTLGEGALEGADPTSVSAETNVDEEVMETGTVRIHLPPRRKPTGATNPQLKPKKG